MQFSASNNMQMLLNILCSLPLDNKLSINAAKCVSKITSPKIAKFKQPLSLLLRLGSANIIQSNAIKILGVKLTDNLSWDTQVKHVQSVVNSMIGLVFCDVFLPHLTRMLDLRYLMHSYYHALPTVSQYGAMDQ